MAVASVSLPESAQRHRLWLSLATVLLLGACVSQETKRDAINDINTEFKAQYETALAKNGSHVVMASPDCTFEATNAALVSLGMVIKQQSRALGFLQAEAPAPLPLTRSEWDRASAIDLPKAKEILRRHVGPLAEAFQFEPQGLDTVITATVIEASGGAQVSLTMRLREIAPPQSGLPRREYPPPSAVQIGLDKIWGALDRELKARPCKS
jgi:hypothetical protein